MARASSTVLGTLAIILAAVVVIVGWQRNHRGQTLQSSFHDAKAQRDSRRPSYRITSSEARDNLYAVLTGQRAAPDSSNWPARRQYYRDTQDWVDALGLDDCVKLIDQMERSAQFHQLIHKLYIRYGVLDAEGAIKRLGGDPRDLRTDSLKLALLCDVIQGWAKTSPADAWAYFERWTTDEGHNPLRAAGEAGDIPFEVFKSWAAQNSSEAFSTLQHIPSKEFHMGVRGYIHGLPASADFRSEATKWESLLQGRSDAIPQLGATERDTPNFWLSLTLATKWMDRDSDSASAWWLTRDPYGRNLDSTSIDSRAQESYWVGLLIENWAGPWAYETENNPSEAVRWIMSNPSFLTHQGFQDQALPAIARHRPDDAMELIRQIESSQRRSYVLYMLLRPPTFEGEGRYRRQVPSAILNPDAVESELATLGLDDDDLERVEATIATRREFDSSQPPPQASTW